jgi:hypothetical protein
MGTAMPTKLTTIHEAGADLVHALAQIAQLGATYLTVELAKTAPDAVAALRPTGVTVLETRDRAATELALTDAIAALGRLAEEAEDAAGQMVAVQDRVIRQLDGLSEEVNYATAQSTQQVVDCCDLEEYWHRLVEKQLLIMQASATFSHAVERARKSLRCVHYCEPHPCTPGWRQPNARWNREQLLRRALAEAADGDVPSEDDDESAGASARKAKSSQRKKRETGD